MGIFLIRGRKMKRTLTMLLILAFASTNALAVSRTYTGTCTKKFRRCPPGPAYKVNLDDYVRKNGKYYRKEVLNAPSEDELKSKTATKKLSQAD